MLNCEENYLTFYLVNGIIVPTIAKDPDGRFFMEGIRTASRGNADLILPGNQLLLWTNIRHAVNIACIPAHLQLPLPNVIRIRWLLAGRGPRRQEAMDTS